MGAVGPVRSASTSATTAPAKERKAPATVTSFRRRDTTGAVFPQLDPVTGAGRWDAVIVMRSASTPDEMGGGDEIGLDRLPGSQETPRMRDARSIGARDRSGAKGPNACARSATFANRSSRRLARQRATTAS